MKRRILSLVFFALISSVFVVSAQINTLTEKEKSEGWVLLFDGKSFDGWRWCNKTEMAPHWVIENGIMRIISRAERPQVPRVEGEKPPRVPASDILFGKKKFKNFELSVDWNIGKGGNAGIFYYVREIPGKPIYQAAPEVQILDNWNAGDNKLTNHLAGSLYDMVPALPQNAKPSGEWNTIVIRVKDGHVTHTQNGVQVCEYTLWTPEWTKLVEGSKFKTWPEFIDGAPDKEGYIGLQDHQDNGCSFRNIKIREL